MTDFPRLIEHAFPLRQASLDSVHEKNVRHGHISTLHIWPARRPLAACRAALIATLLPDPSAGLKPKGMSQAQWEEEIRRRRQELCEKIGGRVVKKIERKKMPNGRVVEREKFETVGGVLHWHGEPKTKEQREIVRQQKEDLEWFRNEIRRIYGRPPRVLDPFAGGGAIPLEAMRLGCEATAVDINPVAWFILKCTLEYPQRLAGQTRPLPEFILHNDDFMRQFLTKAKGYGKAETTAALERLHRRLKKKVKAGREEHQASLPFAAACGSEDGELEADLAWHVRAWGRWVLDRARRDLAKYYPVYADFEPLKPGHKAYEKQPMRLMPLKEDGTPDVDALNAEFSADYLADKRNPRWVAKPTVAYLWARTVQCKNCRATVPLLKTRWLCKKDRKRVLLTMCVEAASTRKVEAASRRLMDDDATGRMEETRRDAASTHDDFIAFFDPAQPIGNASGNLPHWRQEDATYFVTFRLGDSMPQEKLRQWLRERQAWIKAHPEPHDQDTRREYRRLFPARFEEWLDAGYGECVLERHDIKALVEDALQHFHGARYSLDEYVVMPNHVHVLVTPIGEHDLSSIVHSWKSFTAHEINKRLGRAGRLWQKEYFDHIIRGPEQLDGVRQYIRDNPKNVEAASPKKKVEAASRRLHDPQQCPAGQSKPERRDDAYTTQRDDASATRRDDASATRRDDASATRRDDASTTQRDDASATQRDDASTTRRDDASTIRFGVETNVSVKGGNPAQRREHDKRIGAGTMSRSGTKCPCCGAIMTMEDMRTEGKAGRLGAIATAVVVDGQKGKEYRLPTDHELQMAAETAERIDEVFADVPFGVPTEPMPSEDALGMRVPKYGFKRWCDLFTPRQLLSLGTFVNPTQALRQVISEDHFAPQWLDAVSAYSALVIGRTANYMSTVCLWDSAAEEVKQTFLRFALPITWDYAEANPMSAVDRYFTGGLSKVVRVLNELLSAAESSSQPNVVNQSAIVHRPSDWDLVVTDPPYYDAIPYSDLMDFFYIWLRRSLDGVSPAIDAAFASPLSPKWDHDTNDGELVDDSSRHENNAIISKQVYENGMARAFVSCAESLKPDGRLVIVFANKQPAAWETLVSALIRAGFAVDGSWPIATEMRGGVRNFARASLASSVWLVCKKRGTSAPVGWDNKVLEEMRANIAVKLREFWDAGIRGPDFVWAATGPALEAYSKHPVVRKANQPNAVMTVSEFLTHVRRMVVDYIVGQVLSRSDVSSLSVPDVSSLSVPDVSSLSVPDVSSLSVPGVSSLSASGGDAASTSDAASTFDAASTLLDEPTAYYLLHRNDFGLEDAPVGTVILYAVSCGLSDRQLIDTWDLIAKRRSDVSSLDGSNVSSLDGSNVSSLDEEADPDDESGENAASTEDSGSKVRLKTWAQRKNKSMGYEAPGGRPVPLIDRVHRLMHLWKSGDIHKVDEYLDDCGLRRHELFKRLLQSMIELSQPGSDERSLLESLSNHVGAKGARREKDRSQREFADKDAAWVATASPDSE